jgi:hypothetical protein
MNSRTQTTTNTDTLSSGLKALRDMRARLTTHLADLELLENKIRQWLQVTPNADHKLLSEWSTLKEGIQITRRELVAVLDETEQINSLISQSYLKLQILGPSEAEAAFRSHLESLVIHTSRQTRLVCYTFDETMEIMARAHEQLEAL